MQTRRRYVQENDADNPFKSGALWTNCSNCGQALLLTPNAPSYCNGKDGTGCQGDRIPHGR